MSEKGTSDLDIVVGKIEQYVQENSVGGLTNNSYFKIGLDNGKIKSANTCSLLYGYLTLGLSSFITYPYIEIVGDSTSKNKTMADNIVKAVNHIKAINSGQIQIHISLS